MKRATLALVLVSIVAALVVPTAAYAESEYVRLSYSATSANSPATASKFPKANQGTTVASDSIWSVYAIIQYKNSSGSYTQKTSVLVSPGSSGSNSTSHSSSVNWRLQLNPYGWLTSGSFAEGVLNAYN